MSEKEQLVKENEEIGDKQPKKSSITLSALKSSLSWHVVLLVLVTILAFELFANYYSIDEFKSDRVLEIRETGRSAISPVLNNNNHALIPISSISAENLIRTTIVQGLTVYNLNKGKIVSYGVATESKISDGSVGLFSNRSDGNHLEVTYFSEEINSPYIVIARLDSTSVINKIEAHVKKTIVTSVIMSALVSLVILIFLSKWLVTPVIILHKNLLSAARNPENPELINPNKDVHNEIGTALKVANDLIRQNSKNLKRLHTQAENKIHKLAYYDTLTKLPNRTYFLEELDKTIKKDVINGDKKIITIVLDIDHFKDINDTMGHEIGDRLLEAVGQRLTNATPNGMMIARTSADVFALMMAIDEDETGSSIIDKIFLSLETPISIMSECFEIKISAGLSMCPRDGKDARQLLKNADIALNRAKEDRHNTIKQYSEDLDQVVQKRFKMLRNLRSALEQEQLLLYYHPQFDLNTGKLIGAEALIRWWIPDIRSEFGGKFISPYEFIPTAEQSGLIVPIGEWVLKTACKTNKMLQEMGLPAIRMAVNVSGVQFHRGEIVKLVSETLKETGLEPHWLEIEVTESVFMDDIDQTISTLEDLNKIGVELAVDDFGTGYSSLNYLRQFPIHRLKVDQSFTQNSLHNDDDMAITRTIINLGHSLNLKVIAEGVETIEHQEFLKREGCDEVQGFKYSRPIPADKLIDFIKMYNNDLKDPYK